MHFRPNYPIYLQVADYICEKVLTGTWHNGAKLPSVKELAVATSVNPNTVIKALTHLQDNDILTTQRGIGYFLTDEASANTIELKRRQFIDDDLPTVFTNMKLLGLTLADVQAIYQQQSSRDEQG
jgi:DNA-binding transcriptional regulator YhcF (GntR family)